MHISRHAQQRLSQRGIPLRLVDFALRYGRVEGDKHVVDRNESRRIIEALEEELRLAKRVLDKGGIAVVEGGDTLITAYNLTTRATVRRPARRVAASLCRDLSAAVAGAAVPGTVGSAANLSGDGRIDRFGKSR